MSLAAQRFGGEALRLQPRRHTRSRQRDHDEDRGRDQTAAFYITPAAVVACAFRVLRAIQS
jgi:hypothetical protein